MTAGELDAVEELANEMLDDEGWNSARNIHLGNTYMGLIAIKDGDVEEAKRRLLASGSIEESTSPTLKYIGPETDLAEELLKQDEWNVVLDYFELCGKFWERGDNHLKKWTAAVLDQRIPDFRKTPSFSDLKLSR